MLDHQHRVTLHKTMMESINILDMAGLELDDPRSEELLQGGLVSNEIIYNIKKLGTKNKLEKERIAIAKAEKIAIQNGTYIHTTSIEKPNKINPKVQFNPVTNEYTPVYRHPQDGVSIDLIQPMSLDEINAYNNRYSKFNRNKTSKHNNSTSTSSTTTTIDTATSNSSINKDFEESDFTITLNDIQTSINNTTTTPTTTTTTVDNNYIDLIDNNKVCICQRCYRLQHYGQVEENLRPGWSGNELLTPERFEKLLSNIKNTPSVVLCLVDIFDLRGSILKNLKNIVGNNPLVIAANKIDLLPSDVSMLRLTNWIHSEIKTVCGYKSGFLTHNTHNNNMGNTEFKDSDSSIYDESEEEWGEKMKLTAKERKARREERESNTLRRADVHLVSCQTGRLCIVYVCIVYVCMYVCMYVYIVYIVCMYV